MSKQFSDADFQKEVLENDKPVLVDFWAEWCGPCRMLTPVIEELEEEVKDKALVGKLNVDENRAVAGQYQVMSIPTVMIFKGGKVVKQFVGIQPKQVYQKALEEAANA